MSKKSVGLKDVHQGQSSALGENDSSGLNTIVEETQVQKVDALNLNGNDGLQGNANVNEANLHDNPTKKAIIFLEPRLEKEILEIKLVFSQTWTNSSSLIEWTCKWTFMRTQDK